jgi:hypothetical protein
MYLVWLIRLPWVKARSVLNRLKTARAMVADTHAARRLYRDLPELIGAAPSQVVARLQEASAPALYAAYLASDDPQVREILRNYASRWKNIQPVIDGHELKRRRSAARTRLSPDPGCLARGLVGRYNQYS